MCENCYLFEIEEFESENQFQEFDLDLLKKIHNLKVIERLEDSVVSKFKKVNRFTKHLDSPITVETYTCKSCNEIWYLSAPNFPWTGFFKIAKT